MAGPWIDMHAHPGRCFLVGLDSADPLVRRLGGDTAHAALELAHDAGLSAVTFSTVGDLRVLSADPVKGLVASRRFAPGEAREDHRRQLEGPRPPRPTVRRRGRPDGCGPRTGPRRGTDLGDREL